MVAQLWMIFLGYHVVVEHGKMKIQNGKYILMKGSKMVKNEVPSASDWVKTNRKS